MVIRPVQLQDAMAIQSLLSVLGYPLELESIELKLQQLLIDTRAAQWVVCVEDQVSGFISLYLIPQLGVLGDFASINFLAIDPRQQRLGLGTKLLHHAEAYVQEQRCDRMILHCDQSRLLAHTFYSKYGFIESPKYFRKKL
ncbi:hypothetical protein BFG52_06635 [Acinetobacter larvae]|uniref:N-acetyltransferase domain-containing protein n=1 Tax=Acinetobacter larvae TaxID=1789224 RepID=A0A1B2M417_9GAMM|nr:hypothetical protein BFG52_06635 [Acinetobacter larvae]